MSRSHARAPQRRHLRRPWLETVAGATILLLILAVVLTRFPRRNGYSDHTPVVGNILETRIALADTGDTRFGGYILYRIEAKVRYEYRGQTQERWMIASEAPETRDILEAKLATSPKTCQVSWSPDHPENPKCRFQ
jgi:hypothetical protein